MFVGIANTPRNYAWGSTTAIAELLGTQPTGMPEAELWLGTHPGSPALLDDGTSLASRTTLPFLLKVLAASAPLSLQAHPSPEQAAQGFARENALGIPLDAPNRNYRDAAHKPELIFALSDSFRALCGFRPARATTATIDRLQDALPGSPALAAWSDRLQTDADIRPTFEWLVSRGDGVDALIEDVVAASALVVGPQHALVGELAAAYPGDAGIVVSLMLNLVTLRRGEALYLPAGNIHAYIDGLGIELMAASDNVLRGGLTPKHVDVAELLAVLDFTPLPVPILAPVALADGVDAYRPDVPDFELLRVTRDATITLTADAIALCTAGSFTLGGVPLGRGEALYIGGEPTVAIVGAGELFVATSRS